ncbi:putative ABC transport system ATP-binding protein/lipoprotein-releasing system ATP-binding protein [Fulvimarina manganoxydans]|uniref:Putative ABC transport system ATP-binding protein/lipoprotein-releasing system ATP-binding protein n=1 Tax=Fulvimarina manganoxydans TaxID=937218 RepID=A0A1W2C8K3_9HYPH|nr:ATP-binding cassette domain-containing protein [Fulvimarina manganoxydans]MEE2951517.1 ATP-binding cassette domain-containing protein [Pseudomonadota bacterium]SMC81519.1 putative ABC transport system ATP-binding protein/lipoprotein-releasing system ATP-binding protein [Fulvimarina manganoxydans]
MSEGTLRVANLEVRGEGDRRLLAVPDLSITSGETVVIEGPSGAGKTTLLFAIAGLLDRAKGRVEWDGDEILARSARERAAFRRERLGLIFQEHHLFDEVGPLVNAGIAARYGSKANKRKAIVERARTLLQQFGIADDARSVASFSGGERQRIAAARALAHDPAVILADEPTASLDRANADRLISDLMGFARASGKTLIAVSHDRHLVEAADRRVRIVDGEIVSVPEGSVS